MSNIKPFYLGAAIVTAIIFALLFTHVISPLTFWLLTPLWIMGAFTWLLILAGLAASVKYYYELRLARHRERSAKRPIATYNNLSKKIEDEYRRGTIIIVVMAVILILMCSALFISLTFIG